MMKKLRKKNVFGVVVAIIVALCFCSLSFLVPKERLTKSSADSVELTPALRFEYGFNVLDPVIWDFSGLIELGMTVTEDTSLPFGGVYQISSTVSSSYNVLIGRYDKPSNLSQSVFETRPDFSCVRVDGPLPYRIAVSFPELGAYLTTTGGTLTYLPPPSVWTYCEFYFLSSSDNQGEVFSMQFAPCMSIINSLYGRNSTYWQPFIEYVSGDASPEELEQARQEGYNEGLQQAQGGYFNDCYIDYEVFTGNGSFKGSIKPVVVNDGIKLTNLYQELYAYSSDPNNPLITNVVWGIRFEPAVPWANFRLGLISQENYAYSTSENNNPIQYVGSVITDSSTIYRVNARFLKVDNLIGYRLSISGGPDYEYIPEELFLSYAFSLRNITGFNTYDIDDFLTIQFIGFGANQYQAGITEGFNMAQDEFNKLKPSIKAEGFTEGLEEGKIIGFNDGYAEGFSKATSDDPYSLGSFVFSFLDMPGRILYNWLNFDFMGFNLAGVLALIITALIIAYVWKKVV